MSLAEDSQFKSQKLSLLVSLWTSRLAVSFVVTLAAAPLPSSFLWPNSQFGLFSWISLPKKKRTFNPVLLVEFTLYIDVCVCCVWIFHFSSRFQHKNPESDRNHKILIEIIERFFLREETTKDHGSNWVGSAFLDYHLIKFWNFKWYIQSVTNTE